MLEPVRHSVLRGVASRGAATVALLAATPLRAEQPLPQAPPQPSAPTDPNTIIVIGDRMVGVRGVVPERTVDPQEASSYGISTIGELIDEISAQNAESEPPVVLVNGQRVADPSDIADYPVEAVRRMEVLPRGAGVRVGAAGDRRVYNIVLRHQVRTVTATAATRLATEGHWSSRRGEAIFTRIKGPNRLNLAVRLRDEDQLLEKDRGVIQPPLLPYDLRGNVVPNPLGGGTEIDPALSALAGTTVLRAAVPPGTTTPTLANFATTAGTTNVTDLGAYRTLRPDSQGLEISLAAANRLAPWLTSNVSARITASRSQSLLGLPAATFTLPGASRFSPFSRDVGIAAYGDTPLRQRDRAFTGSVNAGLNADFGRWQLNLTGHYNHNEQRFTTDRQLVGQFKQTVVIPATRNPFSGNFSDLLLTAPDLSRSVTNAGGGQLTATGTPVKLPAGPAHVTVGAAFNVSRVSAHNSAFAALPDQFYTQWERSLSASADLPLTSRRAGFLPKLGELNATLEYGRSWVSHAGALSRHVVGLNWAPENWIRIQASDSETRTPPGVQLLAGAVLVTPGVRYYDFLRAETADVTQIYGGNPNLLPQTQHARRVALNLAPAPKINLQITAEYSATTNRNLVSGLPPASSAILLAFPDRFVRDPAGVLTLVDVRPVNFTRESQEQLRYGFSFTLPFGRARPARLPSRTGSQAASGDEGGDAQPPSAGPGFRPRLQVLLYHTLLLNDRLQIRPAIPEIDLLGGGAVGIGGGRVRHIVDMAVGIVGRGMGVRLTGNWRSESFLDVQSGTSVGTLRFSPIATFTFRAYVEGSRLAGDAAWAKGSRLSFTILNLTGRRQSVRDAAGNVPLRYQPAYRDAIGRTIEIELRKVF